MIETRFNDKQRAFREFGLSNYVSVGVEELSKEKLTPLLRLKYQLARCRYSVQSFCCVHQPLTIARGERY
jgi:hypothetical protein